MNKREKDKLKNDSKNDQANGINNGFGIEDFDIIEGVKQNFPIVDTKRNERKKGGGLFG
jgi:hypothetical protein